MPRDPDDFSSMDIDDIDPQDIEEEIDALAAEDDAMASAGNYDDDADPEELSIRGLGELPIPVDEDDADEQ